MGNGIVFFDIDGTLCRYGERISDRLKETFQSFHEKRNVAYLCTGRSPVDIGDDILELEFDGIISCMGAVILAGGVLLQNEVIPESLLKETVEAFFKYKVPALLLGKDEVFRTEYMAPVERETGVVRTIDDLYRNGRLADISTLDIEYATFSETEPYLELIQKHSELVKYNDNSGQTRLYGTNKSKAIQRILELPQYKGRISYAIGDSQNDMEMLRYVDVGIAMGDAPGEVVECAKWQTDIVERNGAGKALEHYGLA